MVLFHVICVYLVGCNCDDAVLKYGDVIAACVIFMGQRNSHGGLCNLIVVMGPKEI